jgi:hypothetical protein
MITTKTLRWCAQISLTTLAMVLAERSGAAVTDRIFDSSR